MRDAKPASITPALKDAAVAQSTQTAKPVAVAPAVPPVPAVPILKVNFKGAYEANLGKKEAPIDVVLKTTKEMSVVIATAMAQALTEVIGKTDTSKPFAISRKKLLNTFCIQQKLSPGLSKRDNKSENKTITTYGVVPKFEDGFEVDGPNYPLVAFLKHPIVKAGSAVAVKYGTYFIVMNESAFKQYSDGKLLDDAELTIVGE